MKKVILFLALLLSFGYTKAQEINGKPWDMTTGALLDGRTIVKANALGWATRNFGFYGERIIHKHVSAVVGLNWMPQGGIPFIRRFSDEQSLRDIRIGSFAFTPEVRFYLSKSGYGRGFYIAPYYKYEQFNASHWSFNYRDDTNTDQKIELNGNFNTHSFGSVIGIQWLVGRNKNIVLDWTIIGAHYGANQGTFNGTSTRSLSPTEQAELKKEIENAFNDVKLGDKSLIRTESITIEANSAQAKIKSPWALIRSSFSIGYRL